MTEVIIILTILFIGSLMQGMSGFGFALFSMGLITIFLPVRDSTLIIIGLGLITSTHILFTYWRHIVWKQLSVILGTAFLGRIAAFFFLDYFGDTDLVLKKWLGIVLIAMVIYTLYKRGHPTGEGFFRTPFFAVTMGLTGGFMGGVFAIGGPFLVVYFLMRFKDKREYNANLQASFLLLNMFTLFIHGTNGDLTPSVYFYLAAGSVIVWFGVKLGLRWFDRMPKELLHKLAGGIVLLAGINLLLNG